MLKGITTILFLICFTGALHVSAQNLQKYDSLYSNELGSLGQAKFTYYRKNGNIIKNGEFQFSQTVTDSLCISNITQKEWRGSYKEGIKTGKWTYSTHSYYFDVRSVNENGISYDFFETRALLEITYKNGFPEGPLGYSVNHFKNKRKEKNTEELKLNINDKKLNGAISYSISTEDQQITISGKAAAGLMHHNWIFENKSSNEKEIRAYQNGVLLSLTKLNRNDTTSFVVFPLSPGIEELLNQKETSFKMVDVPLSLTFSDGYPRTSELIGIQSSNNTYLEGMIDVIFQFDPSRKLEDGLVLGTNRGLYPLTHEETRYLDKWAEVELQYRKRIQEISDSKASYMAHTGDSLFQVVKNWNEKQENLLHYIEPWSNIILNDQLKYYYRQGLLIDYAQDLMAYDTIAIQDTTILIPYNNEKDEYFLSYITKNIQNRILMSDSLLSALKTRVEKIELSGEVDLMSTFIIAKKDSLKSLYNDVSQSLITSQLLKNVGDHFFNHSFDQEYHSFITNEELSSQEQMGMDLNDKLILLETIFDKSIKIGVTANFLDSVYMELRLDPFTYEKIPVRVKKRLYTMVTEDLIPDLIEAIQPNESFSQIIQQLNLIRDVQKRLIALKEGDTRKLEQSIRSSRSTDKRLKILKVQ